MSRRGMEQGSDAYVLTAYRTSIRDDPEECTHVMYPFPGTYLDKTQETRDISTFPQLLYILSNNHL